MTPELKRLETEIFYDRKLRRIAEIREAFAGYMKTLEKPKDDFICRVVAWLRESAGI